MSDDTLDDSDVKFLEAGQFVAKYHKQNHFVQRFAHLDVNLARKKIIVFYLDDLENYPEIQNLG